MSLTVVLPNFNHGAVIGRQLAAIFNQSRPPEKVIIFDDASTDDSVARIRAHIAGHANAELIVRPRNAGVIAAMNEGLARATSEYISFAAADDLVLPGLYAKSLALLERRPQAAFCSAIARVDLGDTSTAVPLPGAYPCRAECFIPPQRAAQLLLRMESWYSGTTIVHRRRCLVEAGGFRPALRSFCDGFVYLVMALRHGACFVPEPLAVWYRDVRGYSTATSGEAHAMAEILQTADGLMSTEFAPIFPPKVRARIRRRLRFRAAAAGRGRIVQALLFGLLRWHDVPTEVRTRLAAGRIAEPA
jgi:glycosyltransferase involved in cell wall biosynthesis